MYVSTGCHANVRVAIKYIIYKGKGGHLNITLYEEARDSEYKLFAKVSVPKYISL